MVVAEVAPDHYSTARAGTGGSEALASTWTLWWAQRRALSWYLEAV